MANCNTVSAAAYEAYRGLVYETQGFRGVFLSWAAARRDNIFPRAFTRSAPVPQRFPRAECFGLVAG
jgi:hypothetical protein